MPVLRAIHESPRRLKSNFARQHAHVIARLASCSLISTAMPMDEGMVGYGHHWRVTYSGLRVLELGELE